MQQPLLVSRRFAPLFWCQFFAAFNDNFLKNALLFLILWGASGAAVGAGEPPHAANALIALAGAVFILPFFLLSALGGELADRYDKAWLAQRIKLVEIAVAVLAVLGFVLHSIPVLFLALFAFGTLSALFGPVKYGILPDHLPREALPAANALVEGATFLAIIGGTAALETTWIEQIEAVDLDDLNPESLWRFRINNFGPLLVAMDSHGNSLYDEVKADTARRRAEVLARLGVQTT